MTDNESQRLRCRELAEVNFRPESPLPSRWLRGTPHFSEKGLTRAEAL